MEQSVNILIDTINKVKEFTLRLSSFPGDVDLVSGHYVIDAKSIMGIFSLSLDKPVKLVVKSGEFNELLELIRQFIV